MPLFLVFRPLPLCLDPIVNGDAVHLVRCLLRERINLDDWFMDGQASRRFSLNVKLVRRALSWRGFWNERVAVFEAVLWAALYFQAIIFRFCPSRRRTPSRERTRVAESALALCEGRWWHGTVRCWFVRKWKTSLKAIAQEYCWSSFRHDHDELTVPLFGKSIREHFLFVLHYICGFIFGLAWRRTLQPCLWYSISFPLHVLERG